MSQLDQPLVVRKMTTDEFEQEELVYIYTPSRSKTCRGQSKNDAMEVNILQVSMRKCALLVSTLELRWQSGLTPAQH